MSKHLAQGFVDLRPSCPASQPVSELRLHHHESCFDVRAFVVVLHESLSVVGKVVVHLTPQRGLLAVLAPVGRVVPESYVRLRVGVQHSLHVLSAAIRFVCAHLIHYKVLRGLLYKRPELRAVSGVTVGYFNARHYVCFHSAADVNLEPVLILDRLCASRAEHLSDGILRANPTLIHARRKARRVNPQSLAQSRPEASWTLQ